MSTVSFACITLKFIIEFSMQRYKYSNEFHYYTTYLCQRNKKS